MSENYLLYRAINETRRLAIQRKENAAVLNPLIAQFIDNAFYTMQTLAIRRLTDKFEKKPKYQVTSIRCLLDDVFKHRHLFTRKIYVSFDGTPFDPEPTRLNYDQHTTLEWQEYRKIHGPGSVRWVSQVPESGPEAWQRSCDRHSTFDRLSGKTTRSGIDTVCEKVFTTLYNCINNNVIINTQRICNKRIAHAASKSSRLAVQHTEKMNFAEIDVAHRSLIIVSQFISKILLDSQPINPAPIDCFDRFEQLEYPWLSSVDKSEIDGIWCNLILEREHWAWSEAEDDILAQL